MDPSAGNWRPSPSDGSRSQNVCGIASASRPVSVGCGSTNLDPNASAVQPQIVGTSDGGGSSRTVASGSPDLKTEVDANAPTFYDLT